MGIMVRSFFKQAANICQLTMTAAATRGHPIGRFGVIADVQYVDAEDGTDFTGVQVRRYRNSLEVLKVAVKRWSEEAGVEFIAQLGDIIDVKARDNKTAAADCDTVLTELNKCKSKGLVNIIGNHDLYCFKREELNTKLNTKREEDSWYSFKPIEHSPLRIVVLDSFDISTIEGSSVKNTQAAFTFLAKHNPNDITKFGGDWSAGLAGLDKRFMPYNGMVGASQLAWLRVTLTAAAAAGESAVLLSHAPLCPGGCDPICLLWNYQEVLDVLKESGIVIAVFAGHDHEGGYKLHDGVHHLTFPSPLLCKGDDTAFATVEMYQDYMLVKGEGMELPKELEIKYASIPSFEK